MMPSSAWFVDQSVDLRVLKADVAAASRALEGERSTGVELSGVACAPAFLAETARQAIEGQIYSSGADLRSVYRTSEIGDSASELIIPNADSQIPILGELRRTLDDIVEYLFDAPVLDHAVQVRVIRPGGEGHPRHVDYADAFTQRNDSIIVPVSLSLPISWNGGVCPTFEVYSPQGTYQQTQPGSLVIFGPRTEHRTPPPQDLKNDYLWLVTQAFLLYGRAGQDLHHARQNLVSVATRVCGERRAYKTTLSTLSEGVTIIFADETPISWATELLATIASAAGMDGLLELTVEGGAARGSHRLDRAALSHVFMVSMCYRVRTERVL